MFFLLILILIFLFFLTNILFYTSIKKAFAKKITKDPGLKISVVVAAKNEKDNITNLIDSLVNQN
jgi:cellulose synthase/poly-beta-1,6-N-acetylglucosamine synthase-like glycosyltransferase